MRKIPENKIKEMIRDKDVLEIYNRYQTYLKELDIYDKYVGENISKQEIIKLYEDIEIQEKDTSGILERFQKVVSKINSVKKDNPDIELRDISTQEGRKIVSNIICETQDDREFRASDLSDVAVIENLSLFLAVKDVNERFKLKEVALVYYNINEEEFNRANESFQRYTKLGIMDKFNDRFENTDKIVHYAAATVQETPINVYESFQRLGLGKGEFTSKKQKLVTPYKVSQLIIDNIMKDPKLNVEEKNAKINELQLAEFDKKQNLVEEANRKQGETVYKVVMEEDGR